STDGGKKRNIAATIVILLIILLLRSSSVWIALSFTAILSSFFFYKQVLRTKPVENNLPGKRRLYFTLLFCSLTILILLTLNKIHVFDTLKNKASLSWEY